MTTEELDKVIELVGNRELEANEVAEILNKCGFERFSHSENLYNKETYKIENILNYIITNENKELKRKYFLK